MATPVLKNLSQKGEFCLLGEPFLEPLFEGFPGVKAFLALEKGRWRITRTARKLRKYRFSRGLLLTNSFSSALIFFLARIPERWGYATDGRRFLLTRALCRPSGSVHQRDYYLGLLKSWGYEISDRELELPLSEKVRERGRRLLAGLPRPYAVLAPGAAYGPAKRWPLERFRALAEELSRRGFAIVTLGGKVEMRAGAVVCAGLPRARNLCGRTDLGSAAAVIGEAAIFVSNDSGLMHVAAALSRPQVAIFGSTDPRATGPLNSRARVIRKGLPCSPCFRRTCERGYPCLSEISAEEVLEAALELCVSSGARPRTQMDEEFTV